jgi:hypothetical protein
MDQPLTLFDFLTSSLTTFSVFFVLALFVFITILSENERKQNNNRNNANNSSSIQAAAITSPVAKKENSNIDTSMTESSFNNNNNTEQGQQQQQHQQQEILLRRLAAKTRNKTNQQLENSTGDKGISYAMIFSPPEPTLEEDNIVVDDDVENEEFHFPQPYRELSSVQQKSPMNNITNNSDDSTTMNGFSMDYHIQSETELDNIDEKPTIITLSNRSSNTTSSTPNSSSRMSPPSPICSTGPVDNTYITISNNHPQEQEEDSINVIPPNNTITTTTTTTNPSSSPPPPNDITTTIESHRNRILTMTSKITDVQSLDNVLNEIVEYEQLYHLDPKQQNVHLLKLQHTMRIRQNNNNNNPSSSLSWISKVFMIFCDGNDQELGSTNNIITNEFLVQVTEVCKKILENDMSTIYTELSEKMWDWQNNDYDNNKSINLPSGIWWNDVQSAFDYIGTVQCIKKQCKSVKSIEVALCGLKQQLELLADDQLIPDEFFNVLCFAQLCLIQTSSSATTTTTTSYIELQQLVQSIKKKLAWDMLVDNNHHDMLSSFTPTEYQVIKEGLMSWNHKNQ